MMSMVHFSEALFCHLKICVSYKIFKKGRCKMYLVELIIQVVKLSFVVLQSSVGNK